MAKGFWREKFDCLDSGQGEISPGKPVSPGEALKIILSFVAPLGTERVPVSRALGRLLASGASATEALPPFCGSRMDGYAVRTFDIVGAVPDNPVILACTGTIYPGQDPSGRVAPGQGMRIMTGAALPEGSDAVVKVEDTDGGIDSVRIYASVSKGENVSAAGEICSSGTTVVLPGTMVRWPAMSLLAGAGVEEVEVFRVPRISIFTTGDELVKQGGPRSQTGVLNATLPALMALADHHGWELGPCGEVGDGPAEIAFSLGKAMGHSDVVVLTGGVSMGLKDHVRAVVSSAGYVPVVGSVSQKPGKPMGIFTPGPGSSGSPVMVFGLPGNPVSSMVCAFRYLVPAMRGLSGFSLAESFNRVQWCILADKIVNRDAERTSFVPVKLISSTGYTQNGKNLGSASGIPIARQLRLKSSADILTFSDASGLIEVPPSGVLDSGSTAKVELFDFPW